MHSRPIFGMLAMPVLPNASTPTTAVATTHTTSTTTTTNTTTTTPGPPGHDSTSSRAVSLPCEKAASGRGADAGSGVAVVGGENTAVDAQHGTRQPGPSPSKQLQQQQQQQHQVQQQQQQQLGQQGGSENASVEVTLVTASQDRFFVLSHLSLTCGQGTYTPAACARVRAIADETAHHQALDAAAAAAAKAAAAASAAGRGNGGGVMGYPGGGGLGQNGGGGGFGIVGGGSNASGEGLHQHSQGGGPHTPQEGAGPNFSGWRRSAADKAAGGVLLI